MLKKILSVLAIIAVFAIIVFAFLESKKDYINGNILNLPITSSYEDRIPSPFSTNGFITGLLYAPLILAEPSLDTFKPHLASSYEILDNGLSYKFTLRNAKWSDGEPITPEDVVFTINTIFIENNLAKSGVLTTNLNKIKNIEINGNEFTLHLYSPHYNLLTALAQLPILPKHKLQDEDLSKLELSWQWSNPVTSGMYKVKELVHQSHFDLEINENFFGEKPKIETIRLHKNLQQAILDYYPTNDIAEMTNFRSLKGFSSYPIDMNFVRYLVFAMQGENGFFNPKIQDRRVREAICIAIDNIGLINTIYYQIAADSVVTSRTETGYHDYNPERAKQLLADAKYDFSQPLRLMYYYNNSTADDVMNYLKKNLEEVGFKVELVKPIGNQSMYTHVNYDVLYKGLASINALEWYQEYHSDHPFLPNIIDLKGEFDTLINKLTESSEEEYPKIYNELQDLAYEKLYKFPIYAPLQIAYLNTARVDLPKNIVFANPWYIANHNFQDWEIKKN